MAWTEPQFSRRRVDTAGKSLITLLPRVVSRDYSVLDEFRQAREVVDNWRSSHSYPLQAVCMTLRNRARSVEKGSIVAQRLKRWTSIHDKLANEPNMKLSQMQDIGGCRAILSSVSILRKLTEKYDSDYTHYSREKEKRTIHPDKPLIIEKYDYIVKPKIDGYRSVHFVCKYQTGNREHNVHNGLRIEIQVRTKLQHMWATAVEVAQTFTSKALRSSSGDKEWRRFFALVGSAFAAREKQQRVPDTPNNDSELIAELKDLSEKLEVISKLGAYRAAAETVTRSAVQATSFLLELDTNKQELRVSPFLKQELSEATSTLFESERDEDNKILRVLVSVDSIAALRRAYPNYYLDTTQFLREVKDVISK